MRLPDPLTSEALEQLRRSIVLLGPGQPCGLDREAAVALLEALQRLQTKDRRVFRLLDDVARLLEAAREADDGAGRW